MLGKNFSRRHFQIFFLLFSKNKKKKKKKKKNALTFHVNCLQMQGDNVHEMSKPIFWQKKRKINELSSAELTQRLV